MDKIDGADPKKVARAALETQNIRHKLLWHPDEMDALAEALPSGDSVDGMENYICNIVACRQNYFCYDPYGARFAGKSYKDEMPEWFNNHRKLNQQIYETRMLIKARKRRGK